MKPSELARIARARLLRMHFEAGVGHLGGNLSCLDALLALHLGVMGPDDAFILSKGHSAGALYVALWMKGLVTDADLTTFHQDNTLLAGHPVAGWSPDIRFATGSLGHGLGLASGTALARRYKGTPGRVWCLMSDGEWQEGSTWEALIFAVHHRLDTLTAVVDLNGLQGFGSTEEVASMGDLGARLRGFGLEVLALDGHDHDALRRALAAPQGGPRVLVLSTVKGKGVSFMEGRMESHYLPLKKEQYELALKELGA